MGEGSTKSGAGRSQGSKVSVYILRGIGVFYILVAITLVADILKFGVRPETFHKVLHVCLGIVYVIASYKASAGSIRALLTFNTVFFGIVALTGWFFRDLGGLDAFNTTDTILHTIVATVSLVGVLKMKR